MKIVAFLQDLDAGRERLQGVFADLFDQISWRPFDDEAQMRSVIDHLDPSVILTFGIRPHHAIKQIDTGHALVMAAPDPQSTRPMTLSDLRGTATALRRHLDKQPAEARRAER